VRSTIVVARQVVSEASRRRLLLALVLLTLVVIALTDWGVSRIDDLRNSGQPLSDAQKKTIVSQLLILVMFMFSWVLSLAAVFIASPAISGELESGIALAILARPISRAEYVFGKWVGLGTLVILYGLAAGIIEMVAVQVVSGYQPPHPFEFLVFVIGEGIVILTFALMLSTRVAGMVGGVIAAILFGIAWLGGIVGGVGAAFHNTTITNVGTLTKLILPTDGLWRGAVWSLEPSIVIAAQQQVGPAVAANPFFAAEPPPAAYVIWAVAWIAVILALSIYSFRAREI
jgi:ABC-type transport system involved in multi-copper enzyme maturation permease subunit